MVIEENVSYEIVPCVKFKYHYIQTNTIYNIVIINAHNNPEVIFIENPEKLEFSLLNTKNIFSNLIGGIFNTQSNKIKNDKINYCKLIIVKGLSINGLLSVDIKNHLLERIAQIDGISNAEIKDFINLCNEQSSIDIDKLKFYDSKYKEDALIILGIPEL